MLSVMRFLCKLVAKGRYGQFVACNTVCRWGGKVCVSFAYESERQLEVMYKRIWFVKFYIDESSQKGQLPEIQSGNMVIFFSFIWRTYSEFNLTQ